jgi:hypothetical protein
VKCPLVSTGMLSAASGKTAVVEEQFNGDDVEEE